jgi:hypothetical protein
MSASKILFRTCVNVQSKWLGRELKFSELREVWRAVHRFTSGQ